MIERAAAYVFNSFFSLDLLQKFQSFALSLSKGAILRRKNAGQTENAPFDKLRATAPYAI